MTELVVPDPGLVVLVGAAGAGKTTFAPRHFEPAEILSSDAYRALVAGDESDQGATGAAFARLHRTLDRRLAARSLTVIDATNVDRAARRRLLVAASLARIPAIAIVLDLPVEVLLARNAGRVRRIVEERVVLRQLARLRRSLDRPGGLDVEGFSHVVVLRDALEIEAIRIVRRIS